MHGAGREGSISLLFMILINFFGTYFATLTYSLDLLLLTLTRFEKLRPRKKSAKNKDIFR